MVVGHADRAPWGSHAEGHSAADTSGFGDPAHCQCHPSVSTVVPRVPCHLGTLPPVSDLQQRSHYSWAEFTIDRGRPVLCIPILTCLHEYEVKLVASESRGLQDYEYG